MVLALPGAARCSAPAWLPALAAAAGVHALAWVVLQGGGLTGDRAPLTGRSDVRQVGAVVHARLAIPDSVPAAPPVSEVVDALEPIAATRLERTPQAVTEPVTEPVPSGGTHLLSAPHWSSDDLQNSPRPELGWVLDEEALESVRQARMLVQVWVAENGRIDRVQLLQAEPPGPWAEQALSRVGETQMRPGIKDGRAVASTVVVEIATEVERFR